MAILESFRVAFQAIWANKMRALLTMLGVIIGVSSVIIMISIVQGLRVKILSQLSGNGANLIFAHYSPRPDSWTRGGVDGFIQADIDAIRSRCTLVSQVDPDVEFSSTAHVGRATFSPTMVGAMPDYIDINNLQLAAGRFIEDADNQSVATVCIIGDKTRSSLFPGGNAIGKIIICDSNGLTVALTVVGVLQQKDRGGFGSDPNNSIFVPLRSAQMRFTGKTIFQDFSARSIDVSRTEAAADQVWAVLKDRHPLDYKDYIVDTQEGLLKQINVIIVTLQLVFGGIAGLSLLTGGIGIMNIMLVSVTERTREIGIRKAVGATSAAILTQFVVEAMVVSGVGGAIGTSMGYGVAAIIDHFFHKNLPTYVPLWAVILGVGFAAGVGMFFGIYPAYRASKLDPIQALRYE